MSQLAEQGQAGLQSFISMLQKAAASPDTADTLDVVFEVPQLGQELVRYAAQGQVSHHDKLHSMSLWSQLIQSPIFETQ